MPLTNVDLSRIDGTVGSISTANINNIKNASSGSNNIVLNSDGTTTLTPSNIIKSGTAVATTSGVAVDFTGIPSWVKRITVILNDVSTNGTSALALQLGGSGGFETTGYNSIAGNRVSELTSTSRILLTQASVAADVGRGMATLVNVSGNTWVSSSLFGYTAISTGGATKTLSGVLTQVRITTVNGIDIFDAGSVNILYEG